MGARYESSKPDGYMRTRNNIFLERELKLQDRTYREQGALRDLPEQTRANYGDNDLRFKGDKE